MSNLVNMYRNNKKEYSQKRIDQIVNFTGDGNFLNEATNIQVREYFSEIEIDTLKRHINECIESKIENGGFILQDLINEVGRRLGFRIKRGLYRGTRNAIGYDGLWESEDGYSIVVETKTTDAYRINLDTIEGYRKQVIEKEGLQEDNISILIVSGRKDTGDLEAQIKGSRHAWHIRLVSVDALIKLLELKVEKIGDTLLMKQIYDVLRPFDYTRIDKLIDLLFRSADDADDYLVKESQDEEEKQPNISEATKPDSNFHDECKEILNEIKGFNLKRKSRVLYGSDANDTGVVICVSKAYGQVGKKMYWFALHPYFFTNLQQYNSRFIAYGCGSPNNVLLIPLKLLNEKKNKFNQTKNKTREYWHIRITEENGAYYLHTSGHHPSSIDITEYLVR